jgi:hypothetical protein
MPENPLYLSELNAGFDQVRGIRVPQTVRRNLFFEPLDSTTDFRAL